MPIFTKETAKVKMVALTKTGMKNITWYNREKDNSKTPEQIMREMYNRFIKRKEAYNTQVICFYDATTGAELAKYTT